MDGPQREKEFICMKFCSRCLRCQLNTARGEERWRCFCAFGGWKATSCYCRDQNGQAFKQVKRYWKQLSFSFHFSFRASMTKCEVKMAPFHGELIFFVCYCCCLWTELYSIYFPQFRKARLESKNVSGFEDLSLEDQANCIVGVVLLIVSLLTLQLLVTNGSSSVKFQYLLSKFFVGKRPGCLVIQ